MMSQVLDQLRRQMDLLASAAADLDNASVAMREKNQDQVREILHRGAGKIAKVSESWREFTDDLTAAQLRGEGALARPPWEQFGGAMGYDGYTGPQRAPSGWPAAAPEAPRERRPAGPGAPGLGRRAAAPDPAREESAGDVFAPVIVPDEEPTIAAERQQLEEEIRAQLRLLEGPYLRLREYGAQTPEVRELLQSCREALSIGSLRDAALSLNASADLTGQLLVAAGGEPLESWVSAG